MSQKINSSQNKSEVRVKILGEEYLIRGSESQEYIRSIACFVDEHMCEIQNSMPKTSRNRVIVLGAMNLADKLCRVQRLNEKLREDNNKIEASFKLLVSENNMLKGQYQDLKEEYEEFLELVEKGEVE